MGTGMALPWPLLAGRSLATDHIVEDMQLGLDLAEAGSAPQFCPQAVVTSRFPIQREARQVQRTRWEHGHMALILARAPGLIAQAWHKRRPELLAMAADLCVPPLASLVLSQCVLFLLALALAAAHGPRLALWLCSAGLAAVVAGVMIAWSGYGRHIVSLPELLGAPWYVLAKLPMIWRMLTRRQTRWIRTERDDPG
jgi:cellulose synthase/poly-beta-1,6-N-acetylglucosamine synthase-like glycosyltransferase